MSDAHSLQLSLVSHTNAGKTTLARTLLGRDVGEVRDAPHVTEFADAYEMLRTPQGETLRLWDTPGFGDSVRLLDAASGRIGVGLAAYSAREAVLIRGRRSEEVEALLGYPGPAALIHRDDLVLEA